MWSIEDEVVELWGWTNYFNTLSIFLLGLYQNNGIANLWYTEHTIERLGASLSSIHLLNVSIMKLMVISWQEKSFNVLCNIKWKWNSLQVICREWQSYADIFYSGQRNSGAYRVSMMSSGSYGWPKF